MEKVKVDFLVVGTAKAATTSLYYFLKQHPDICLPTKETFFFISELYKEINEEDPEHREKADITYDIESYSSLMSNCSKNKTVGEIGTGYLYYYETAIKNIKMHIGDPKIIIILRNPTERAYSNYMHFVRNGKENRSFEDSLLQESIRKKNGWDFMWNFTDLGFYSKQVESYLNNFSNVKILFYDDFQSSPSNTIAEILEFLELDTYPIDTSTKYNVSGELKNNFIANFLLRKNKVKSFFLPLAKIIIPKDFLFQLKRFFWSKNLKDKKPMSKKTVQELQLLYKNDILKLEKLINTNLDHWYNSTEHQ